MNKALSAYFLFRLTNICVSSQFFGID